MGSSANHVPLPVSPVAGVKRPAPSLLPAFELSLSPQLPRPLKRIAHASPSQFLREHTYPTPVATSSTLIPSSSPPRLPSARRPGLQRSISALSERAPLSAVPSIELSQHGEPTLMGRSSNSSHYQLSSNRLISRIHVRAVYIPATPPIATAKVKVECMGWNGAKVHCLGKAVELARGDTFTSETEDADIMIDVQDARVLLTWPKLESKLATPTDSDLTCDSESSPQRRADAARDRPPYMSPLSQQARLQSPISPSPAVQAAHVPIASSLGHGASHSPIQVPVQVYEDKPSNEVHEASPKATQSTQFASQPLGTALRELESSPIQGFSDNDEENDPIISSFGPFGANLGARMESFNTSISPHRQPLEPLKEESISPQRQNQVAISPKRRRRNQARDAGDSLDHQVAHHQQQEAEKNPITSHVINQLAYSRLSSTPLSTLMQSLPTRLKAELGSDRLKSLLDCIRCVGEVPREGKDAAGKQLESEYYYIPEGDVDEGRREMVEGLGGRGLRSCRKSHKQYFWRKPK